MKLQCSVSVGNRLLPTLAINSKRRYVISTLALCKNPKSKDICLILFSAQNKNGTKYQLAHLDKVLTRFVNEGKATLQFNTPQHDLYIQADSTLLKSFLNLLKQAVLNNPNLDGFSTMSVTNSKPVVKKLVIERRSEFPTKGFPRTLEVLYINGVSLCAPNKAILQLTKLRVLDLSRNCLEELPPQFSAMCCLEELNVSHNQLCKAKKWDWLGGNLAKTLIVLDLRYNSLRYLPVRLRELKALINLHLDCNNLKTLPPGIGFFKHLRDLTASNNLISMLPSSASRLCLQVFDISGNYWSSCIPTNATAKRVSFFSLRELAGRCVINRKLSYTPETLPGTLIEELKGAGFCNHCGLACVIDFITQMEMFPLANIAHTLHRTPTSSPFIPMQFYYCSVKCFNSKTSHRRMLFSR